MIHRASAILRTMPVVLGLLILLLPAAAAARESHSFKFALMGGLGGATDAEPDVDLDNAGFQLMFAMTTDSDVNFAIRAGRLDMEAGEGSGLFDSELTYVTLTGEYMVTAGYYESGLFFGIGVYDLDDTPLIEGESALGITLGVSGDFRLSDRFSFLAEFSGHYADFDRANVFLMGHAGLAFKF